MNTKMVSCMKHTKDRMDNLMPVAEMNQLLDVLKTTGATHIEIATVIGHPNFAGYSRQWADAIHSKGMSVTWRCAHKNMEGLYGAPKFVGAARKPEQFWIDEAVNAFSFISDSIHLQDEEAIYPERTEGIFQDATAFIGAGLPGSYATFFINLHNALKFLDWTVGLSANNASELMSGWMPSSLVNYKGVAVVDHYRDGDPVLYEKEIRDIKNKYGKPVYVQEGAPHRFTKPTKMECDAYYAVNKKLADEGILVGFGSWSGWAGNPESIVDKVNGLYQLNDNGLSLKAWWDGVVTPIPVPQPIPSPTPSPEAEKVISAEGLSTIVVVTSKGNLYKLANGKWTKLPLPTFI